ncbi:MAG: hypothetical protein U0271_13210 [Polyangiaceae bacterium]
MTIPRTRRRWLEVLRRSTHSVSDDGRERLEAAAIWDARERAARAAQETARIGERIAATAARQRASVESAQERATALASRGETLTADLRRVTDSLDRLSVVGLNAGLEGARTAEPAGRALTVVGEEVRAHVTRATEAAKVLETHMGEAFQIATDLSQRMDRAQREAQELSQESSHIKPTLQECLVGLGEIEAQLRRATGLDPESARQLAAAAEHAKGLLTALTALESAGAAEATRALAPVLGPVVKLLGAILPGDGATGSTPSAT